ncbi:MAG: hypothetical protein ACI8X5_001596 [Planctomycetota bacterium]|jgi:hypothetical protein
MNEELNQLGPELDASNNAHPPLWLLMVMGWMFASTSLLWARKHDLSGLEREKAPKFRLVEIELSNSSARELRQLPGIGPSRSAAIVDLRWKRAGREFGLKEVPGIGALTEARALEAIQRER